MRAYTGMSPNGPMDPRTRANLVQADLQLKALSNALSPTGSTSSGGTFAGFADAQYLVLAHNSNLTAERRLTVSAPLALVDGGANSTAALSVTYSAPTITLGTSNVEGIANNPIRSDATIKAFNTVTPSPPASAASVGTEQYASASNHVHVFPVSLQSTGTIATLTLTAAATTATLTSSLATLIVTGETVFQLGATTNTVDIGTTTRRVKKMWCNNIDLGGTGTFTCNGTSTFAGLMSATDVDVNGVFQAISGVSGDWFAATAGGGNLGSFANEWASLILLDTSAAFGVKTQFSSSGALTANRTLTIDMSDGDRTIDLRGNPILDNWFDQNVKTTADPAKFNTVAVLDTGTSFYLKVASNSAADLSADRTLTVDVANADRTVKITGNAVINQDTTSSSGTPQFVRMGLGTAADGTVLLTVNDGVAAPSTNLIAAAVNRYGGDTNYCGDPAVWLRVRISGTNYKIPCFS